MSWIVDSLFSALVGLGPHVHARRGLHRERTSRSARLRVCRQTFTELGTCRAALAYRSCVAVPSMHNEVAVCAHCDVSGCWAPGSCCTCPSMCDSGPMGGSGDGAMHV